MKTAIVVVLLLIAHVLAVNHWTEDTGLPFIEFYSHITTQIVISYHWPRLAVIFGAIALVLYLGRKLL